MCIAQVLVTFRYISELLDFGVVKLHAKSLSSIITFQTGFLAFEVAICHWNACDLAYISQWNPSPPIPKASEKTAPFAVELRHFLDDRPGYLQQT